MATSCLSSWSCQKMENSGRQVSFSIRLGARGKAALIWNYIIYYKNVVFFWLNWPFFWPAAALVWNYIKSDVVPRSISPQRSLSTQRLFNFFFSAISAISAVNSYVSFLIRLAAFQASDSAYMCQAYSIYQILVRLYQTKCEQHHIIQSEIPNPKDDYSHQSHEKTRKISEKFFLKAPIR